MFGVVRFVRVNLVLVVIFIVVVFVYVYVVVRRVVYVGVFIVRVGCRFVVEVGKEINVDVEG